jgi:hypothetical protein
LEDTRGYVVFLQSASDLQGTLIADTELSYLIIGGVDRVDVATTGALVMACDSGVVIQSWQSTLAFGSFAGFCEEPPNPIDRDYVCDCN